MRLMKILITTFGRDDKKLAVARRDIGYDKLVIITDEPELKAIKDVRKMESITGGDVDVVKVNPYKFFECFYKVGVVIDKYEGHDIRFNTSGGPKILSFAALVMCFNKGVPAYHSEIETVRLPVILGARFEEMVGKDERKILRHIKDNDTSDAIKAKTGLPDRKFDAALMSMERKGMAKIEYNGESSVSLTPVGVYLKGCLGR